MRPPCIAHASSMPSLACRYMKDPWHAVNVITNVASMFLSLAMAVNFWTSQEQETLIDRFSWIHMMLCTTGLLIWVRNSLPLFSFAFSLSLSLLAEAARYKEMAVHGHMAAWAHACMHGLPFPVGSALTTAPLPGHDLSLNPPPPPRPSLAPLLLHPLSSRSAP